MWVLSMEFVSSNPTVASNFVVARRLLQNFCTLTCKLQGGVYGIYDSVRRSFMVTDFSEEISEFVFRIVQELVDPEDEGSKLLRNFCNYAPADKAQYLADLNLYEH